MSAVLAYYLQPKAFSPIQTLNYRVSSDWTVLNFPWVSTKVHVLYIWIEFQVRRIIPPQTVDFLNCEPFVSCEKALSEHMTLTS